MQSIIRQLESLEVSRHREEIEIKQNCVNAVHHCLEKGEYDTAIQFAKEGIAMFTNGLVPEHGRNWLDLAYRLFRG